MTKTSATSNIIKEPRHEKAHDHIDSVAQHFVHLLFELERSNADPEKLKDSATAFETARIRLQESEISWEDPVTDLLNGLAESLEFGMDTFIKKEIRMSERAIEEIRGKNIMASSNEDEPLSNGNHALYDCKFCRMQFKFKYRLNSHIMTHLPEDDPRKRKFECDECGKCFTAGPTLRRHKQCHLEHEEERLPHKCEDCGRRFADSHALTQHAIIHLPDNDPLKKKIECNICGISYGKHVIRIHQKTHLDANDPRRKMQCDICGKMVTKLSEHRSTHLDENDPEQAAVKRQHECEYCGKRFTQASALGTHRRIHSDSAAVKKPFKCGQCGNSFSESSKLKRHINIVHESEKAFQCDICGRTFSQKGNMKSHRETHGNNKPHMKYAKKCNICGKMFEKLNEHMVSHVDFADRKRPFECDECGRPFARKKELQAHIRFVHRKQPRPMRKKNIVQFSTINAHEKDCEDNATRIMGSQDVRSDKNESMD